MDQPVDREHIMRLSKDLSLAAKTMTAKEARFLVDAYYLIQEDRKRSANQQKAMEEEPHSVIAWFAENNRVLEDQLKKALDSYSMSNDVGRWARAVKGIGPVIAAGLIAHIDIEKAPTVGHIWRFAGLDPSVKWEKGKKRPWNAALKVLCWKIGQSFVKVSGGDDPSPYGAWYRKQKAVYVGKNEAGDYAERATTILATKNFGKTTDAYQWLSGEWVKNSKLTAGKQVSADAALRPMLPPAQIDQMAQRWATKLFLAHLHGFWYEKHFGRPAPLPYAISHLGHAHIIEP